MKKSLDISSKNSESIKKNVFNFAYKIPFYTTGHVKNFWWEGVKALSGNYYSKINIVEHSLF